MVNEEKPFEYAAVAWENNNADFDDFEDACATLHVYACNGDLASMREVAKAQKLKNPNLTIGVVQWPKGNLCVLKSTVDFS